MIAVKITHEGPIGRELRKQLPKIHKSGFTEMGNYWWAEARPRHFTKAGARMYRYAPRRGEPGNADPYGFKKSYTGQKLRKYGHTDPLVASGTSKRLAGIRDVRATSKGGRVVVHARVFNRRNPFSKIRMQKEIKRISTAEERAMLRVFRQVTNRRIKAINTRKTTRV